PPTSRPPPPPPPPPPAAPPRRYGVRLVSLADLEAEASEFAIPLPDDVLPKLQAGSSLARTGTPAVRPASDLTAAGPRRPRARRRSRRRASTPRETHIIGCIRVSPV